MNYLKSGSNAREAGWGNIKSKQIRGFWPSSYHNMVYKAK